MLNIINISGFMNIASGVLLLAYWYLYAILMPYRQLSTSLSLLVLNKHWTFVNLLGAIGALLGIVGLVGLFMTMEGDLGKFGSLGFILALLGSILMFSAILRDTLVWPILAKHDPTLLDFNGPIYTSKTFLPFFIISGLFYAAGFVLFGLAIADSSYYPKAAGMLLVWGVPLFGMGAMFGQWQVYPRTVGMTALSIGLIWIGNMMRINLF